MTDKKSKLKIKNMHPVLRDIFEVGCELEYALAQHIKIGGEERTCLNLTDFIEKRHKWKVHFAVEKTGKLRSGMSMVLYGVTSEAKGLEQLARIASDLQKAYGMPYTPAVYRDGEPVQLGAHR